jgi:hypothetical protein
MVFSDVPALPMRPKVHWLSIVTYTFMPCQNEAELLWSHVYTMHARTCLPVVTVSFHWMSRSCGRTLR